MKLIYDQITDRKQLRALTRALLLTRKGEKITCMDARLIFGQMYGLNIDHHEYSTTLDNMTRTGEATRAGWNSHGEEQYLITG